MGTKTKMQALYIGNDGSIKIEPARMFKDTPEPYMRVRKRKFDSRALGLGEAPEMVRYEIIEYVLRVKIKGFYIYEELP